MAGFIVALFALAGNGWSKTNEELARENQELKQRVEKLEEQLQKVLQIMEGRNEAAPEADKIAEAKPAKDKPLFPITNQFPITLYVHFKLDGAMTTRGPIPETLPNTCFPIPPGTTISLI
jgi:type II secretory pathway component PulJ